MRWAVLVARSGDPVARLRETGRTPHRARRKLQNIADAQASHMWGHAGGGTVIVQPMAEPEGTVLHLTGDDVDYLWVGWIAPADAAHDGPAVLAAARYLTGLSSKDSWDTP